MEQRVQGDLARRDLVISRGLKGDHVRRMHINEGMPTERCHRQNAHTFSKKSSCLGASEVLVLYCMQPGERTGIIQRSVCSCTKETGIMRVIKQWNRMPRAVMESPSWGIFKTHLDTVLTHLL